MPHSSGGGSHHSGGGSHHSGGSHRSSGGSGGGSKSPTISRSYSSNSRYRYVYYHNRRPRYVYSDRLITNKDYGFKAIFDNLIVFLFFIPFVAIGLFVMVLAFNHPKRLDDSYYNTDIVIEDNLNALNDYGKVYDAFVDFREVTGITPALITVSNDDWREDYDSLTNYAFDLYVNHFADEKHWLIVYSTSTTASGFDDWYFEGMQGNDTDRILTEAHTEKFNKELEQNLTARNRMTIEEAFEVTFENSLKYVMKTSVEWPLIGFGVLWLSVIGICMWIQFSGLVKIIMLTRRKPEMAPMARDEQESRAYEIECKYCGGIYIKSDKYECPHCGGVTTFDENGNYN